MSLPTVSVITLTYNHQRVIGSCIQSVLDQTYQDWEMIIVNDGSTDSTESIVRGFSDPRISYIRQENVGAYRMVETYNRALEQARGEYIAILEGDDIWPPYKLERQVPLLQQDTDAVASYGVAGVIGTDGSPQGVYPTPRVDGPYVELIHFLTERAWLQPVTLLIRRDALLAIGGFAGADRYPSISLTTWLKLARLGPFRFDRVLLGLWRRHQGQVTSSFPFNVRRSELILDFVQTLDNTELDALGIRREDVIRPAQAGITDYHWSLAREACVQGEWSKSRQHLRTVLGKGSWFRRSEALILYAASLAHLNVSPVVDRLAATRLGAGIVRRHNVSNVDPRPQLLVTALATNGEIPHGMV